MVENLYDFFFQDNQSSNGTFVNNNRCTLTKEPHEVFSGDVVQFGIPVVESAAGNTEKVPTVFFK